MHKTFKLALCVLVLAGVAGCSGSNDEPAPPPEEENSHSVVVTGIEVVNSDNGQPVSVEGVTIFGSVVVDE